MFGYPAVVFTCSYSADPWGTIKVKPTRIKSEVLVRMSVPEEMRRAVESVLQGEYEPYYFGEELTILDIGANVGAFTIWANMRWPRSTINAYEPHPETYAMLLKNVETLSNVTCHNVAVYPSEKTSEPFWSRFAGDVEAGLTAYAGDTFQTLAKENIIEVPVLHPRSLPAADIIKVDVEGGEAAILCAADLRQTSLVLLEYNDLERRNAIASALAEDFILEYEQNFAWDLVLAHGLDYKKELQGNRSGTMFFANRRQNRLRRG